MSVVLLACVLLLVPGTQGAARFVPEKPKVDLDARYSADGVANYVGVRCTWTGPSDVSIVRLQVLGPRQDDRERNRVLGVVDSTGQRIQAQDEPGMTIVGSINCGSPGSNCPEGVSSYVNFTWPTYHTSGDNPETEKYGCTVWVRHQSVLTPKEALMPLRVRGVETNDTTTAPVTTQFPEKPKVDLDARYRDDGFANYVGVRCTWTGPSDVIMIRMQVLGPRPDFRNLTRVLAVIDRSGPSTTAPDEPGITVEGSITCGSPGSNCPEGVMSYANLTWPTYHTTRDNPESEQYGCQVWVSYQGRVHAKRTLLPLRVRDGDGETNGTTDAPQTTQFPEKPKVGLEVRYLTEGLANYVSVRCTWTGPSDVIMNRLEVMGPTPDDRIMTRDLGVVDRYGNKVLVQNVTGMTVEGSINCGSPDSGCPKGVTAYAYLVWPTYHTSWDSLAFEKYGCQVWGTYQRRMFVKRTLIPLRVREDEKYDIIDPRITHDSMHFRLRSGLQNDGTVKFLFMRCSARLGQGMEVKAIEIFKPSGSILTGVYAQGNLTNPEGSRARSDFQFDCTANPAGCHGREKAYLGVIWRKMDFDRDIGVTQVNGDFYALTCKVTSVVDDNSVVYEQTRAVRVRGGMGSEEK